MNGGELWRIKDPHTGIEWLFCSYQCAYDSELPGEIEAVDHEYTIEEMIGKACDHCDGEWS